MSKCHVLCLLNIHVAQNVVANVWMSVSNRLWLSCHQNLTLASPHEFRLWVNGSVASSYLCYLLSFLLLNQNDLRLVRGQLFQSIRSGVELRPTPQPETRNPFEVKVLDVASELQQRMMKRQKAEVRERIV